MLISRTVLVAVILTIPSLQTGIALQDKLRIMLIEKISELFPSEILNISRLHLQKGQEEKGVVKTLVDMSQSINSYADMCRPADNEFIKRYNNVLGNGVWSTTLLTKEEYEQLELLNEELYQSDGQPREIVKKFLDLKVELESLMMSAAASSGAAESATAEDKLTRVKEAMMLFPNSIDLEYKLGQLAFLKSRETNARKQVYINKLKTFNIKEDEQKYLNNIIAKWNTASLSYKTDSKSPLLIFHIEWIRIPLSRGWLNSGIFSDKSFRFNVPISDGKGKGYISRIIKSVLLFKNISVELQYVNSGELDGLEDEVHDGKNIGPFLFTQINTINSMDDKQKKVVLKDHSIYIGGCISELVPKSPDANNVLFWK